MLRSVVLPLAIGYAGILVLIVAGTRRTPEQRAPTTVPAARLLRHVATTVTGGTIVLMGGMLAYCGGRGVNVSECIADPMRGALPLAAGVAAAFLLIEGAVRLLNR